MTALAICALALSTASATGSSVSISLDSAKTGTEISPLIYGQFIEHLGRCIYGGIWAEMLEDRKFYHGVGEKDSPWKPLDAGGAIAMTKEGAYCGEHAPLLKKGQGIGQGGLAVVPGVKYVGRIVYSGGPIDVRLVWGDAPHARTTVHCDAAAGYTTKPFSFGAGESDNARVEILAGGDAKLGPVSLMPENNIEGMRADTLELLKQLDSPIYRWPGGNFVSGYDWQDGIGDRDKRPPRKNPAWLGVEHNDFGMHEYMRFCELIGTDAYITVNSGQGGVELARAEVEYAVGAPDSPMGRLRAQNGHPEPWHVAWWAVGNEMYGDWQLGHMPLSDYVKKHNTIADAMRAVDPKIKLVAVGASGPWSQTMLAECAGHMDALSEHFYIGGKADTVEKHVREMTNAVRTRAKQHREYWQSVPALKEKRVPVAMDEWNYWYGPHLYGELGTRYFLKDGLGVAAGLHQFFRDSDVYVMANYAQTVNVIGAIKTNRTSAAFETTGLVLKLYRRHFGKTPIAIDGEAGPLDVCAAWTEKRDAITIGVINPTAEARELNVAASGTAWYSKGAVWRIAGQPMDYNAPESPNNVAIRESEFQPGGALSAPGYSVSLYRLPVKK